MPIELLIQGIDQASDVLDRVGQKTESMGSVIARVGAAAAAVGGFVALAGSLKSVIDEASAAQDKLAGFDAVLKATQSAAADQAAEYAAAQGKTITVQKLSDDQLDALKDKLPKLQAEYDALSAKIAEETRSNFINSEQHYWTAEATATHAAALEKMKVELASVGKDIAKTNDEIAKGGPVQADMAKALGLTPPVAMLSRQAMLDLADAFGKTTKFEDEAVLGAETVLLTFRNIGKDVMPQATEATLNLATMMGTDAGSAARMLGKALVEPGEGLLRLKAAGINFSDSQTKMIQKMFAAGDVAGAQKMILDALDKSIGGVAVAAGQTLSGQMLRAEHAIGNVKEEIGGALLPVLQAGQEGFLKFIDSEEFKGNVADVVAVLRAFAGGDIYGGIVRLASAFGFVEDDLKPLVNIFNVVKAGFLNMLSGFQTGGLSGGLGGISTLVAGGLANLVPTMQAMGAQLVPLIQGWAAQLGPPIMALVNELVAFLLAQLPVWVAAWWTFEQALWSWIATAVPPMLAQLQVLAVQLFGWVAAQIPVWTTALGALVGPLIAWVLDALPGLGANLGVFTGQLLAFVLQLAIDLAGALLPLAWQFVSWIITDVVPQLPGALMQITAALMLFLLGLLVELQPVLVNLGQRFVDWVTAPGGPAETIGGALATLWTNITTAVGKFADKVKTDMTNLGRSMLDGLIAGIKAQVQAAIDAIRQAIQDVLAEAAKVLGAHSPSRVFFDFGAGAMVGFAGGTLANMQQAVDAVGQAMANVSAVSASLPPLAVQSAGGVAPAAGVPAPAWAGGPSPSTGPAVVVYATVSDRVDIEELAHRIFEVAKLKGMA